MKKFLSIFLILIISMSAVSCGFGSNNNDDETKPPYVNEGYTYYKEYSGNDIKLSEGYNKALSAYYTSAPATLELSESLKAYMDGGAATYFFAESYNLADDVSFVNIYGPCLEYTSLVTCLFWKDERPFFSSAMVVDENESGVAVRELEHDGYPLDANPLLGTLSITDSGNAAKNIWKCMEEYPSFRLIGIVYDWMIPIGYNGDDPYLKGYMTNGDSTLNDFYRIGPVKTIDEGIAAYDKYWNALAEELSHVPHFSPKSGATNSLKNSNRVCDADTYVTLPLYDKDGNSDAYILCLYYRKNTLVAEVLLKKEPIQLEEPIYDGGSTVEYHTVREYLSEKSPDGEYIGLDGIEYVNAANDWLRRMEDVSAVKGFGFDGEEYFPVT